MTQAMSLEWIAEKSTKKKKKTTVAAGTELMNKNKKL
jgi:hypothetical protein